MRIHPTAVVDKGAQIGKNVNIGPFSCIEADTVIHDGVVIGAHVTILRHTTIGSGSRVHPGAIIGDLPQDLSFKEAISYVRIGCKCIIREGVTIHRGTKPDTATEIGDECYLMANSHFAHNVKLGKSVIVANGVLCAGYVEIGDRAFISGNCAIHQFVKVGRLAMLGGLCAVSQDVPPFFTTRPVSLNTIATCNVVGMRRAGIDAEGRNEVKKSFKLIYRSNLNVSQAVQEIRTTLHSGPAIEICEFIEKSKRGICGYTKDADASDEE